MLIDFPNFSHLNPWQVKTIQTANPMEVKVTSNLELSDCYALHISWEEVLLRSCDTLEKAERVIAKFEEYLRAQSSRSKIIWTVHNLTSHSYALKDAEKELRAVIFEYASMINLMSNKHAFIVPEKYRSKINILPHYIESSRYSEIAKRTDLTFFRYGADRGRRDNDFYLKVLNNPKIKKFVSDPRLNNEADDPDTVITKRRFTFLEASLYAQLSNFSLFYQDPKFNSGVMNFLIGNKLAVFHDANSVQYMDLPESFSDFCIDLSLLNNTNLEDLHSLISVDEDDVESFIRLRSVKKVSEAFWKGVYS